MQIAIHFIMEININVIEMTKLKNRLIYLTLAIFIFKYITYNLKYLTN